MENKGIDITPHCGAGIENRNRIDALEKSDGEQWEVINQLRNRPPVWTTVAISLLTFLLGCSITYIVK